MFGFGDDQVPFTESVDLLEDLVVEYITEMVRKQDFAHIYSPIVIKEITNSMQLSLLNLKDVYMPLEGKTTFTNGGFIECHLKHVCPVKVKNTILDERLN